MTPDRLKALVIEEMERCPPLSQFDCCLISARVAVSIRGTPADNGEIISCAHALARGLFEEAFDTADENQRAVWLDMAESALRQATKEIQ